MFNSARHLALGAALASAIPAAAQVAGATPQLGGTDGSFVMFVERNGEHAELEASAHVVHVIGDVVTYAFEHPEPHHVEWHGAELIVLEPFVSFATFEARHAGTSTVSVQARGLDAEPIEHRSVAITTVSARAFDELRTLGVIDEFGRPHEDSRTSAQGAVSPLRTFGASGVAVIAGALPGGGGAGPYVSPWCGAKSECTIVDSGSKLLPSGEWEVWARITTEEKCKKGYTVRCVPAAPAGHSWQLAPGEINPKFESVDGENSWGTEVSWKYLMPGPQGATTGQASLTIEAMALPLFSLSGSTPEFEADCSVTPLSFCVGPDCGIQN